MFSPFLIQHLFKLKTESGSVTNLKKNSRKVEKIYFFSKAIAWFTPSTNLAGIPDNILLITHPGTQEEDTFKN
jgi:hypothetical protein